MFSLHFTVYLMLHAYCMYLHILVLHLQLRYLRMSLAQSVFPIARLQRAVLLLALILRNNCIEHTFTRQCTLYTAHLCLFVQYTVATLSKHRRQ